MNILDFTKYFSNQDVVKYVFLISFIWIFFSYTLQNQQFTINFIIRSVIIIGILYILLNLDLKKKKSSKNNFKDQFKLLEYYNIQIIENHETIIENDEDINKNKKLTLDMIENDEEAISFFHRNLNLRKINYKAFNQSMIHFNNFLKLKNDLLEKKNTHYKQVSDLLDMEQKNTLNNFASITINIKTSHLNHSWEDLLTEQENKITNELVKLEQILLNHHSEIKEFLKTQFYNEPITQNSFPTYTIENQISGDLTKTNNYSENFTLYT